MIPMNANYTICLGGLYINEIEGSDDGYNVLHGRIERREKGTKGMEDQNCEQKFAVEARAQAFNVIHMYDRQQYQQIIVDHIRISSTSCI